MLRICNTQELLETAKKYQQIVCFGAGKRFERLQHLFEHTVLWEKIEYIIDNDETKQGTKFSINGKIFKVLSLSEFKKKHFQHYAIIITQFFYEDIITLMKAECNIQNVDFYCLSHTIALMREKEILEADIPPDLKICQEPLIPKVIHYCWFGGKPIPDQYKIWMESWHKFCPDFGIMEWNEQNYDITQNKYMYEAYEKGKWAFVPDYARLDIVYQYGGIYLDTDVELLQGLDDLLYQKGFAGFETSEYVALGLGFGAVKGLPIIKAMRDMYDDLNFFDSDGNMNLTASPHWQTDVLKRYGLNTNGMYQIVQDMTIYPVKVLNGQSIFRHNGIESYPRAIHHYEASSWQDKKILDISVKCREDIEKYYYKY